MVKEKNKKQVIVMVIVVFVAVSHSLCFRCHFVAFLALERDF